MPVAMATRPTTTRTSLTINVLIIDVVGWDNRTRRHRRTEREEDAAMLHEAASQTPELAATFNESPAYVEGGKMRPYQIQGLNWLISLYEHRVNGILADEMVITSTLLIRIFNHNHHLFFM